MPVMSRLEVEIRPATLEHLSEIARLAGEIWHAYYPGIISPDQIDYMLRQMYSLETLATEISQKDIHFERLLLHEKLIGFASYGPTTDPRVYKLHKLYVLPEQHGRGLGSQLLTHCERAAAGCGAQRLILAVNKRNERAMRSYQRNGYTVIDSVVVDIGGGHVMDDFIMSKTVRATSIEAN